MTAPAADAVTETEVELEIPCECTGEADHARGECARPADLWVIIHDVCVCVDCRTQPDGRLSLYICTPCWERFSNQTDAQLRSVPPGHGLICPFCGMRVRRRTDVIHKVTPLRGVKK